MPTMLVSYEGEAALTALTNWDMPEWQARQALATARLYGLNRIPVNGGYGVLEIRCDGGRYFEIGAYTGKPVAR